MSTSTSSHTTPATLTTSHGDVACLSFNLLDPAAIEASVRSSKSGAVVSFVGYTRDEFQGRQVTHLVYEAYVPLALKTMGRILEEARNLPPPPPLEGSHQCCASTPRSSTTPQDQSQSTALSNNEGSDTSIASRDIPTTRKIEINRIHISHLLGPSPPLNPSIVITVASPHRREAFWLTEWLLERVKERVQVWKREYYAPVVDEEGKREGEQPRSFVGRDGEGPLGMGGRAGSNGVDEVKARWKENFAPEKIVKV